MKKKIKEMFINAFILGWKNSNSPAVNNDYVETQFERMYVNMFPETEPLTLDEVFPLPTTKSTKGGKK